MFEEKLLQILRIIFLCLSIIYSIIHVRRSRKRKAHRSKHSVYRKE